MPASPNYGVSVDTYAVVVIENKETGERVEIPVSYPLDDQTVINTVDLLLEFIMKKLNTDFANFTICTPIPGTEYYDKIKNRIYEKDWEKFDNFHPVFEHKNLSASELRKFQEDAIVNYYIRPKFILKHLVRKLK